MSRVIEVVSDIAPCLELRRVVFIEEQDVSEAEEMDGLDGDAIHILASEDGVPMGTARVFVEGDEAKIGRVCVSQAARGTGLGAALMEWTIAHLEEAHGVTQTKLGAQVYVIPFYEKLGYRAYGPVFDDAGIPHQMMERKRAC